MSSYYTEDWFSLLSGFAIFIMGLRVYWLDSGRRMYQTFMISTFFLFAQNLFFFQMEVTTDLMQVRAMRPLQENMWNLAILFILSTMWYYAQQFAPREMKNWERRWYQLSILLGVVLFILQGWTEYGHGLLVANDAGKWALQLLEYEGHDVFRVISVFLIYSCSMYLSFLPYYYAQNTQTKGLRVAIFIIYSLVMVGSFTENYVLTYFLAWPCPLNESLNVAVGALFSGLMIINLQLTDLQSEYAVPNLLKTMTNWFILTDSTFRIKQVNEAFLDQMGGTTRYWQDKPISEVLPAERWQEYEKRLAGLSVNTTETFEVRVETRSEPAYLLFLITPLHKRFWAGARSRKRGFVFVGTDLTRFKDSEEKIRAYANDLEVSNQALERFAYIASHDLKEPIRNIGNFAGLIRRRLPDNLQRELGEYVGFIEQSVDGMNTLIEAVMAISRLGQDALRTEKVNTNGLLQEVESHLGKRIKETGAQIKYQQLPIICGDPQLLRQLFQNLIDNALKYNDKERPQLEICANTDLKPGTVQFRFKDDGIGIEPHYRDQVFEMFKRLHTRSAYPGTGIGLAICRRIVELHQGKIWIEDRPAGTGTVFVIELPVNS